MRPVKPSAPGREVVMLPRRDGGEIPATVDDTYTVTTWDASPVERFAILAGADLVLVTKYPLTAEQRRRVLDGNAVVFTTSAGHYPPYDVYVEGCEDEPR